MLILVHFHNSISTSIHFQNPVLALAHFQNPMSIVIYFQKLDARIGTLLKSSTRVSVLPIGRISRSLRCGLRVDLPSEFKFNINSVNFDFRVNQIPIFNFQFLNSNFQFPISNFQFPTFLGHPIPISIIFSYERPFL